MMADQAQIEITERAAARLRDVLARHPEGGGVRLYTKAAGCSGLMYRVEWVERPCADDAVVEAGGVSLFVDKESLPYLKGLRMDWKEDRFETGFVFDNPNAKALCGCGESFMV
ncbi:MAG: iron-sulfur cluster assembly protein IscA [Rhodothalassiaceae bacterium]